MKERLTNQTARKGSGKGGDLMIWILLGLIPIVFICGVVVGALWAEAFYNNVLAVTRFWE